MALELLLLVPVLVLLTVFVLWAGRGGRAALTADLAAEEAATAAALCCQEGSSGAAEREALVEDMLDARPGLGFLCIGGPRPDAPADDGTGSDGFLREHWLEFAPGRETGGVGVLGVQFLCESDGAVAPLRGLFPTVTFHGQATEVVQREARLVVGFTDPRYVAQEGPDSELVFTVRVQPRLDVRVSFTYKIVGEETTAEPEDFGVSDFAELDQFDLNDEGDLVGTVDIDPGQNSAKMRLPIFDDNFYEDNDKLVLELTGVLPHPVQLDTDHITAVGEITDNDPQPHLFIAGPDPLEEVEGGTRTSETTVTAGTLTFKVRLRDETNTTDAPSETAVSVDVRLEDITTTISGYEPDYEPVNTTAYTWSDGRTTLTFDPLEVTIDVVVKTLDDTVGEDDETFKVVLENPTGAPLGSTTEAVGTILDDEVRVSVASVEAEEGDASTPGTLQFQVVLDREPNADLTLEYELVDPNPGLALDTAQRGTPPSCDAGDDYLDLDPTPGTLDITWPHLDPLVAVEVPAVTICGDSVVEPDETLWLRMWVPSRGEAVMEVDGGAFGTILNDDIAVISVDDETASEAPAGGTLTFTVRAEVDGLPAVLTEDVTVEYDIVGHSGTDSATAIDDFRAPPPVPLPDPPPDPRDLLSGTLTFTVGGDTEIEVPVDLLVDYLPEDTETFHLVLSSPSANAELFDRDPDNAIDEPYAVGTILDDPPRRMSVDGFTGPEDSTQEFTVSLDMAPRTGETVEVDYAITGGTGAGEATEIVDYEAGPGSALSGTLTFGPLDTGRTVAVRLLPDAVYDADETLRIALSNAQQAFLDSADTTATGTINDVDPPVLTVDDPTALEGDVITFEVTLERGRTGEDVTVNYAVENRSAKECQVPPAILHPPARSQDCDPPTGDYVPVAQGTLTLNAANDTATVSVQTLTDKIAENPETLHLVLSGHSPTHVALDKAVGVGTIANVNPVVVRVDNPRAVEGENLEFVISLVDDHGDPVDQIIDDVTVEYRTVNGTARVRDDYLRRGVEHNWQSHRFRPGQATTRTVPVTTLTDNVDEDDETMALILRVDPTNDRAVLGDAEGTGTIIDRPPPDVRIDHPPAVREGDPVTFTVSLYDENDQLTSTSKTVTVEFATGDRTAQAGLDYVPLSGTVTFIPGDQTEPITVATLTDSIWEPEETFRVDLSQPENAILDKAVGIGGIRPDCVDVNVDDQDNRPPVISVRDEQGPESSLRAVAWLTLSRPLCDPFSFTVRVVEGTTGSPATDDDFDFSPSLFSTAWGGRQHPASLSEEPLFAENHPFTTGMFGPLDDTLDEDDEYFYVEVAWHPTGMPPHYQNLGWARATVTIIDDDDPPKLRISDAAALAGESMTFDVTLDAASGRTVEVDYRTVDVTADGGVDYDAVSTWTTLTFAPGVESLPITVLTASNSPGETDDETFLVELDNAVHAGIDDGVAVGTILAGAGPSLTIFDAAGDEGGIMSFPVRLGEPAAQVVTVDYATVERTGSGAAEEGVDYQPDGGTLTFQVGDQEEFIDVTVEADSTDEPDETFLVELSNQTSGVSLADASAVGTINGNVACVDRSTSSSQPMPTATFSGTSASEDAGQMTMTMTLTQPFCEPYNLFFHEWSSGTATVNVDWAEPASVRLPALDTAVDFHAVLFDDDLVEGDESFRLRIWTGGSPGIRNLPEAYTRSTIIDDDVTTLQVPAVGETSTTEGGFLSFVMRLDKPTEQTVTFDYETTDGSVPAATAGADYSPVQGTATIAPGELSVTVPVSTVEEALFEHDENVELRLSNLTGAEPDPGGDVAVGHIVNDDDPPAVSVSNPAADEGGVLVFEVTLDAPAGREASVSFSTRDGPTTGGGATADDDYEQSSGPLDFAAGETAKTVSVQSLTDGETEGDELFFLDLTSSVFGFDKDIGTGIIRDVTPRRVSVSDAVVREGGVLNFVVGYDGTPVGRDITVAYSTVAVTAEAGADYSAAVESAPRVVRILAGRTSAVVGVPTEPDSLDEDLEQLRLVLSDPVGAVLVGAGEAVGTIIDDDPEPLLSVDDPEAAENGDGTPVVFTLRLSEESGRGVSVRYSTLDGSATADDDYVPVLAVSDERATIPAGALTAQVEVTLVDDDVEEEVERFLLELSDPSNARFGDSAGAATILDDDGPPQILIDDAAATYEAAGASVSFPVRLSRADPDTAVTVDYATEDATATAGDDYTHTSGTSGTSDPLTFAAGQTAATVTVDLVDDDIVEDTETFRLRLSNPSSNATVGNDSAVATVLDDDALPELSVSDAPVADEGAAATFSVELSRLSAQAVTVAYAAVTDPTAGDAAATSAQDFEAVAGTLTIPARSTSATVTVPLPDDALDEHAETFWLRLADPVGADILDGTGVGTIADDDPLPQLNIGDSGATEGETIHFEVTLDTVSGRTVTLPWTTAPSLTGDPASPTDDYITASGTLTFGSGTTAVRIDIDTVDDEVSEPDETFQVQLGQPINATVEDGVAVGAIIDDDGQPRISITGVEITEDDSPAIFVVTLSRTSSQTVTMDYFTTQDTATAGDDYGTPAGEATGTLVIPAGLDLGEISVFVVDDDVAEGTETFWVTLHNAQNAVIAEGAGTAVGTILDDDVTRIAIGDANAHEADGTIEFPVTLSSASDDPVTVRYTTFDGSATQPDDYTAASATLTIAAQTTTATIAVTLTDDPFGEDDESLLVRLSDLSAGVEIGDAEAIGVIIDDDSLPVFKGDPIDVGENEGTLTYTVTLSRPSDKEVSVDYRTVAKDSCGGPAQQPFTDVSGTLVFEPGAVVQTVDVPLVDNDRSCPGQLDFWQVQLELTNPVNATVDDSIPLVAFIWDDEHVPRLGLEPRREQAIESAGEVVFTIMMRRSDEVDVTIPYRAGKLSVLAQTDAAFAQGQFIGKNDATATDDFTAVTGIATIGAGRRSTTISVPIVDDSVSERVEHFGLLLTLDGSEYRIDGVAHTALGSIVDDDGASLSVADIEVSEGAGSAFLRVVLDRPSTQLVTVQYVTADGTAVQPADYAQASGELRFEAGAVEAVAEVALVDDTVEESDETFTLKLRGASGAVIPADGDTAVVTIRDNDGADALPVLTVMDGSAPEQGPFGFDSASFHYTLSKPSTDTITFDYRTIEAPWLGDRAATARIDYQAGPGTVSIPPGDTEGQFSVNHVDDLIHEHDEMYMVWLSEPTNAVLGTNVVWGTILNDDAPPVPIVSIADATASESDGFIEFELDLHEPGLNPATVRYTTVVRHSEGEAAASPGDDYTHTEGRLPVPAGVTTVTIRVPIVSDSADELDETFLLELSEPEGLSLSKSSAVGTITDDDPGWVIDDRSVGEDAGSMVFTVTRDHTGTSTVTLNYTVTGASAMGGASCTAGVDYITPSGSVTLQPPDTQAQITVTVCNDDVAEGSEALLIELTGVPGRKLTGTGTIVAND